MNYKLKQQLLRYKSLTWSMVFLKRLYRNGKFLLTRNLEDLPRSYDMEFLRHELPYELARTHDPVIKSVDETLDMLIHTNNSLCRFGDGEFENALQWPSPFQYTHLPEISAKLLTILSSQRKDICICLPRKMYEGKQNLSLQEQLFWRKAYMKTFYDLIDTHCHIHQTYYATEVSMPFAYQNVDLAKFFSKVRQIWQSKDITIIANKSIFNGLQYNIFDNAASVELMDAPSKNAFAQYPSILQRSLQLDKARLIIIILGQTATVLAYDLACQGFRALDFGHIAKTFDWYKKGKLSQVNEFFRPD